MGTWIKLYREFLSWEWFDKPEMVQLFIWFLLNATTTDYQWHGQTIKRGQLVTTEPAISEGTGLSRQQVRTCIGRFIATKEVIRETIGKSTDKKTLITVCKYDYYQSGDAVEQPTSNRQATDKQPTYTSNSTSIINKNNNNSSSTAPARTREEGFIEQMKSSQLWLEAMAKNYGLDIPRVVSLLDEFKLDSRCRNKAHRDYSDACAHFNDWLLKRQRFEREAQRAAVGSKNVNELWQ